jgi:hypothetical protein
VTSNGFNDWDVPFSHILWFERLLQTHQNIIAVSRHHDLIFEVDRKKQKDHLTVFCCRKYTMGLTMVQRALHEFGALNIIYIGGGWSGYTNEAKDFCLEAKIGLYVTDDMSGALWQDAFWAYYRKDKDGNSVYSIREP